MDTSRPDNDTGALLALAGVAVVAVGVVAVGAWSLAGGQSATNVATAALVAQRGQTSTAVLSTIWGAVTGLFGKKKAKGSSSVPEEYGDYVVSGTETWA